MNNTYDEILRLINEFHIASKIGIFVLDTNFDIMAAYKLTVSPNLPQKYLIQLKKIPKKVGIQLIYINQNEYLALLTGPSSTYPIIVLWNNRTTIDATGYFQDTFPDIGSERLLSYAKVLYFSLFSIWPEDEESLTTTNIIFNNTTDNPFLESKIQHNDYYAEQRLLCALEAGDIKLFNQNLSTFISSGAYGKMSKNELRNKKNILIACITLFTRSAIKAGLPPTDAYNLSDKLCQKIEYLSQILSVSNLIQEIGYIFINRITQQKSVASHLIVKKINSYIQENITKKITLTELAKSLGYNKQYLCHVYKNETDRTIISYINELKINEFQSLLVWSDMSLIDICNYLCFSSPSYASKIFKNQTGETPFNYRQKYKI